MDANPVQSGTDLFKEFINRSLGSKLFSVPKSSPGALPSSASKAWRRYYVTGLVSVITATVLVGGRYGLRQHVAKLERRTTNHEEAPEYSLDNPHIRNHYRPQLSLKECFLSAFAVHNETFNIISHGVGTFFFASLLAKRVLRYLRTGKGMNYNPPLDQSILMSLHSLAYVLCFGISAIAHTFSAHSKEANDFLFKMDRGMITLPTGITVLMSALFAFPQPGWERYVSSTLITISALYCSYNVFKPNNPSKSKLVLSFIALGVLILWPILSQLKTLIERKEYVFVGKILFYFLTGVAPLLISGAAFALRFPEGTLSEQKWAQPLIDLGFNGHGLMHVLVAWHGLVAYRGLKMWNRERKFFL